VDIGTPVVTLPSGENCVGSAAAMLQQARAADAVRPNCRCRSESVDGVVLLADPSVIEQRLRIAELGQATGMPTAFQLRENVEVDVERKSGRGSEVSVGLEAQRHLGHLHNGCFRYAS
jgi:hypothetical protein